MRLNQIKIGNLKTPNNVFLAPLAGYTNAVFRNMCRVLGAGLTFTEMVSAKGLCYDSKKTEDLLYVTEDYEGIKACQIFGGDPEYMRRACGSEALKPFELIDINMGCPVPKIYKNGEGSALLNDLPLASKIISECKKSGKIISVKFRIGVDKTQRISAEFAKMCEDSGADMITVHGRTRDKMYSGEVNFDEIAAAKNAVKIPVIANGGIFTAEDADELINKTGADGVMVARGAMFNPWLFAEITGTPTGDKRQATLEQIARTRDIMGERFACVFMRKMVGFYIKGQSGATSLRAKLLECKTTGQVAEIVNTLSF